MKLIKFLAMMLMAATMSFGMTACGDDDDDDDNGGFGGGAGTATYTVSADKLEIEMNSPTLKEVETAIFDGQQCTSWQIVFTHASENDADLAWKEMSQEGLEDIYSKNGKIITCDMGKISGLNYMTYEIVKISFDEKAERYEKLGIKVIRK